MTYEKKLEKQKRRNKALYEKFGAWVLLHNVWTGELDMSDPEIFDVSVYDCIPVGWGQAFGMEMIEELGAAIDKAGLRDKFWTEEIKEKYGELRIYHNGATEEMNEIIDTYTFLSRHICEGCGRPDVGHTRGWIEPCCLSCYGKMYQFRNKTPQEICESYLKEVGPMGEIKWFESEGKRRYEYYNRMPDTRTVYRYSKEGNTKTVYNVKETADKIRRKWNLSHPEDPVEIR